MTIGKVAEDVVTIIIDALGMEEDPSALTKLIVKVRQERQREGKYGYWFEELRKQHDYLPDK